MIFPDITRPGMDGWVLGRIREDNVPLELRHVRVGDATDDIVQFVIEEQRRAVVQAPRQNMHVEVFDLPAKTDFTLFVITTPAAPFVPAWYQGDLTTNGDGKGVMDVTGIFSAETFILNPGPSPVQTDHLGIWFADPADAVNAGCPGTVTPFDGDHQAGIQVLNTSNFPVGRGPLLRVQ